MLLTLPVSSNSVIARTSDQQCANTNVWISWLLPINKVLYIKMNTVYNDA